MIFVRGILKNHRSGMRGSSKETSGFLLFDKQKFIESLGL